MKLWNISSRIFVEKYRNSNTKFWNPHQFNLLVIWTISIKHLDYLSGSYKLLEKCIFFHFILWCKTLLLQILVIQLPILFRIDVLALRQSYDCPSASEVIRKNVGKIYYYQTTAKHNQAWTICTYLSKFLFSLGVATSLQHTCHRVNQCSIIFLIKFQWKLIQAHKIISRKCICKCCLQSIYHSIQSSM